jgi:hypothetical protein
LKSACTSKTTKQNSLGSCSLIVEKFCDFFSIAPYFATFDKLPLSPIPGNRWYPCSRQLCQFYQFYITREIAGQLDLGLIEGSSDSEEYKKVKSIAIHFYPSE